MLAVQPPLHALIEEVLAALDTEGLSQKAVNELAVGVILFLDINPVVNLRVDCGAVSLIVEQHLVPVGSDIVGLAELRNVFAGQLLEEVLGGEVVVGRNPRVLQGGEYAAVIGTSL